LEGVSVPVLKLEVDSETYDRLVEEAVLERRPVVWQAEVAIRRAVGLPFPYSHGSAGPRCQEKASDEPIA